MRTEQWQLRKRWSSNCWQKASVFKYGAMTMNTKGLIKCCHHWQTHTFALPGAVAVTWSPGNGSY